MSRPGPGSAPEILAIHSGGKEGPKISWRKLLVFCWWAILPLRFVITMSCLCSSSGAALFMLSIYTGALVEQSCSRISFFHHVVPRLKITELRMAECLWLHKIFASYKKRRKVTQKKRVPTPDLSRLSVFAVETYLLNEFGGIFCLWQRKFEMRRLDLDSQSLNWLWNRSKCRHFLDKDKYCINSANASSFAVKKPFQNHQPQQF